jgi:site-specific DNA-methyltransferase (adenine-specific)
MAVVFTPINPPSLARRSSSSAPGTKDNPRMKLVTSSDLFLLPNRQRQEFDEGKLLELQDSIRSRGLFNPLTVRPRYEGGYYLVAGERRKRAIDDIWALGDTFSCGGTPLAKGVYPCLSLEDLDELEAEEAELDENIRRTDLTWQEHALAIQRLAALREKQAATGKGERPTLESLAAEASAPKRAGFEEGATAYGKDTIRKELIAARMLDNPEVQKAKTLDEAVKVIKRQEEVQRNATLAASIGGNSLREGQRLVIGDAKDVIAGLPDGSFDVLLTDPPYGMGADEFGDSGGRVAEQAHAYADDEEYFRSVVLPSLSLATQKLKPQAHVYCFCDIEKFFELREFFIGLGLKVFRTPLVWHKPGGSGRVPLPEHGPRRQYELILYAFQGDRRVQTVQGDVISIGADTNLGMAAQKPVALYQDLLKRSCRPGDSVLDPFCGTGTIFPAAFGLKLFSTGIERQPSTAGIAATRLEGLGK